MSTIAGGQLQLRLGPDSSWVLLTPGEFDAAEFELPLAQRLASADRRD
jgi:hypothetical protein